jgi:hypothetical protein
MAAFVPIDRLQLSKFRFTEVEKKNRKVWFVSCKNEFF